MNWQLTDAKNRFSELVNRSESEGPQVVRRRGENVAVVVSFAEYQRLVAHQPSLLDYLRSGPSFEGLDLGRDNSSPRAITL